MGVNGSGGESLILSHALVLVYWIHSVHHSAMPDKLHLGCGVVPEEPNVPYGDTLGFSLM